MSLADFFDTSVRIWRPTSTITSPLGAERRDYEIVLEPAAPNAAVNRPTAPLGDKGPGLAPIGERRIYMAPETDVQARDVLELVAGPDAGQRFEVDEPPTRPGNDHVQLRCRFWEGDLTPLDVS